MAGPVPVPGTGLSHERLQSDAGVQRSLVGFASSDASDGPIRGALTGSPTRSNEVPAVARSGDGGPTSCSRGGLPSSVANSSCDRKLLQNVRWTKEWQLFATKLIKHHYFGRRESPPIVRLEPPCAPRYNALCSRCLRGA